MASTKARAHDKVSSTVREVTRRPAAAWARLVSIGVRVMVMSTENLTSAWRGRSGYRAVHTQPNHAAGLASRGRRWLRPGLLGCRLMRRRRGCSGRAPVSRGASVPASLCPTGRSGCAGGRDRPCWRRRVDPSVIGAVLVVLRSISSTTGGGPVLPQSIEQATGQKPSN